MNSRLPLPRLLAFLLLALPAIASAARDAENVRLPFDNGVRSGIYSVHDRLIQYAPVVEPRMKPMVLRAGLFYPPRELAYVTFKDARRLEVYGRMSPDRPWRYITRYKVLAASGKPGPKLAEGDMQVPEGIYLGESLNPNSRFHLSIRLNYPNQHDRDMARKEGRSRLGGDIMIHGNAVSIGCLAVGDQAAEDLFILAALAAPQPVRIVISPTDFRDGRKRMRGAKPLWVNALYAELRSELKHYPADRRSM